MTQPFNLLIDPRLAEEGVTAADLREQYEHNTRMLAMSQEVDRLAERVEQAVAAGGDTARRLEPLVNEIITPPIRYSAPGIQEHIDYLRGMTTSVDQKIGRDAIERYQVLRRELDELTARVNAILGPGL